MDITVRRNAYGRQVDSFEADLYIEGVDDESFPGVFIRAPWIESHGEDVEVLLGHDGVDGGGAGKGGRWRRRSIRS